VADHGRVKTRMQMKSLAAATLLAASPLSHAGGDAPPGSISIENRVRVLDNTAASRGQAQVAARIAATTASLAGSDANALALDTAARLPRCGIHPAPSRSRPRPRRWDGAA